MIIALSGTEPTDQLFIASIVQRRSTAECQPRSLGRRRLVESVVAPEPLDDAVMEGIRRLEDMVTGRVKGLTEEEYRAALE